MNYLRYFHTSEASLKDKDILKNEAFMTNEARIRRVMFVPFLAQIWQLTLINQPEMLSLYRRVRVFKTAAFLGALAIATNDLIDVKKKWQYYDRFYPEMTELQKQLTREAQMFKENTWKAPTLEERFAKLDDADTRMIYKQMYLMAPQ